MRRRWTADKIAHFLKEAERDLAKGLTVSDVCLKHGISQSMYYRWRQKGDPETQDSDRRCRELEVEVDRLKRLVAELLLDKQMLQDIAKKSGESEPAASGRRLPERVIRNLATADRPCHGAVSLGIAIPSQLPGRRAGFESGDQTVGPPTSALWIPDGSRASGAARMDNQHQTREEALDRAGAETAREVEKNQEIRPQTRDQRQ
jgi:putative transposase